MNCDKNKLLLYAVTDRSWLGEESLYRQVQKAIKGGATFIQLREKELDRDAFLEEAVEIGKLCRMYGVPLIINDDVEIAKQAGADGIHVGQDDMEVKQVRAMLGPDKIIGVSAHTVEEALLAEAAGADYLGAGAVFGSSTKEDVTVLSHERLQEICGAVKIPVVAIGGINRQNIMELKGTGISGVAVVSAIFAQEDIEGAAADLRQCAEEIVQ